MKKFLLISLLFLFLLPTEGEAQVLGGNRFLHADTLNLTTTNRDTIFAVQWKSFVISVNTDAYVTLGAPDTAQWSTRTPFLLQAGQAFEADPGTPVTRLKVRAVTGTGVASIVGDKRSRQYAE